jgi:hypothetical protein
MTGAGARPLSTPRPAAAGVARDTMGMLSTGWRTSEGCDAWLSQVRRPLQQPWRRQRRDHDAANDADAISNVPCREARQEMIKAVRATLDRVHVLSNMDDELKRLLINEFRVVSCEMSASG